jgi:type II secretory pathway pseudopilin PulG
MLTFSAMLRSAHGTHARVSRRAAELRNSNAFAALASEGRSESGVTLIEVVISAMLVAIIVVGTLTGFDSASRATSKERQRNQATLLAGQDEERMRAMNITELGRLGASTSPAEQNGTKFTIESKAQFVSAAKEEFACEVSGGTADYIQTTSKVSWASLTKQNREPEAVTQSSLIPVPTSSSLLVNVRDQANEDVEGATVKVTGESGTTYEQTTPESGCVIFGALPDKKVKITGTKTGWINEKLESEPAATEAQLSTSALVTKTFAIANPGSLLVEFQSAGNPVGVQGDTVYVAHTGAPEKLLGTAGTYSSTITVPGLWPYQTAGSPPGPSPYTVYAGCKETNPATISKGEVATPAPQVEPGAQTPVKVELPAISLKLYEGSSSASPGLPDSKAEAKLTFCGSSRTMKTTTAGALEQPYQPYTKLTLCLTQLIGSQRYKYSSEVSNTARAGVTVGPLYMSSSIYKSTTGC